MVVICFGLAAYIPGTNGASLSVLRTFRVLRPLRSLRATPTLRQIAEALLGSIPGIVNVLILQTMVFVLFAVVGLQVRYKVQNMLTSRRYFFLLKSATINVGVIYCRHQYPSLPSGEQRSEVWPRSIKHLPQVVRSPPPRWC